MSKKKCLICLCCLIALTGCSNTSENVSETIAASDTSAASVSGVSETVVTEPVWEPSSEDQEIALWLRRYMTNSEYFTDLKDYQYYARAIGKDKDFFVQPEMWEVFYNKDINRNRDINGLDIYLIRLNPYKLLEVYAENNDCTVDELCKRLSVSKEQFYYNWGYNPASVNYYINHKDNYVTYSVEEQKIFGIFNNEARDVVMSTHNVSLEISDEEYRNYLNDKKLSFEFKKLTRKHCYFNSRYNHIDYSVIKTDNGAFVSKSEAPSEMLTLRIDASEVSSDDTAKDIVIKLLKKNVSTFPDEGTIMQTSYNNDVMIFAYSKGVYKEISYKEFISNIVDIGRIHELSQLFSNKHLIRLTSENDVEIIVAKDGVDYRQENDITDVEFEACKGAIREQLARRFALERKKTDNLRTMSQLKVEAENTKREEEEAKRKKEEERQRKREEEQAKREFGRKKNGE
ncbi:MAG: hypothetical protein J6A37_08255 [Oscillospiraceae bacterium]|nr:hypothetical protein [Oscillospiraceae bacterium]